MPWIATTGHVPWTAQMINVAPSILSKLPSHGPIADPDGAEVWPHPWKNLRSNFPSVPSHALGWPPDSLVFTKN